jgi:hypothetical protein
VAVSQARANIEGCSEDRIIARPKYDIALLPSVSRMFANEQRANGLNPFLPVSYQPSTGVAWVSSVGYLAVLVQMSPLPSCPSVAGQLSTLANWAAAAVMQYHGD